MEPKIKTKNNEEKLKTKTDVLRRNVPVRSQWSQFWYESIRRGTKTLIIMDDRYAGECRSDIRSRWEALQNHSDTNTVYYRPYVSTAEWKAIKTCV